MSGKGASSKILMQAAEENPREFFRTMLKEEFQSTKKAEWVISGVPDPFFNPVVMSDLPKEAGQDIRRMVARFDSVGAPMSWWVSPHTRPKDLADQLLAIGFKLEESVPVMTLQFDRVEPLKYPDGLTVRQVRSEKGLEKWYSLWSEVFGISGAAREPLFRIFLRKGWAAGSDVVNYTGFLGDQPVAVSALFLGRKAAGIYNVGTAASARGRGIGTAMTHLALSEARRRNRRLVTLQSSKGGYDVYRRLGFEEQFKLSNYIRASR